MIVRNSRRMITEEEVKEIVARKLADSRQLRGGVYFIDAMPTTPSGKIRRSDVKRLATELF